MSTTKREFMNPLADLAETEEFWVARLELPGVRPDDIDVRLKGNKIVIRGNRNKDLLFGTHIKDRKRDLRWIQRDRQNKKFKRNIILPASLTEEKIKAKCRDGILEIMILKPNGRFHHDEGQQSREVVSHRERDWERERERERGSRGENLGVTMERFVPEEMAKVHPEILEKPKTVVYEHIHKTEISEKHIPQVLPLERHREVHQTVVPIERVEVHKHIHPKEKVRVVEHIHPRERIDIHEHVRPVITTEVHEHIRPEVTRVVHKDVYPEEIRKEEHVDVDLGEVERKVVEKDLGIVNMGEKVEQGGVIETSRYEGAEKEKRHHHHHHHHHHGHHDFHLNFEEGGAQQQTTGQKTHHHKTVTEKIKEVAPIGEKKTVVETHERSETVRQKGGAS